MTQATGLLGLMPEQFWALTPREFGVMIDGYELREEREWRRTAQLASWIMQSQHGKKAPTVDKLLGKNEQRKERRNNVVSIDEKRKTLDSLTETLGKAVN